MNYRIINLINMFLVFYYVNYMDLFKNKQTVFFIVDSHLFRIDVECNGPYNNHLVDYI